MSREVSAILANQVRRGGGSRKTGLYVPVHLVDAGSGNGYLNERVMPDPNMFGTGRPMAIHFDGDSAWHDFKRQKLGIQSFPLGTMEFRITNKANSSQFLSATIHTYSTYQTYAQTYAYWLDQDACAIPGMMEAWEDYPVGSRYLGAKMNYNLTHIASGSQADRFKNYATGQWNARWLTARITVKNEGGIVVWDKFFYPRTMDYKFGVYQKDKNSSATAFFGSTNRWETWGHAFPTSLDFCFNGATPQALFTLVRSTTQEYQDYRRLGHDQFGYRTVESSERYYDPTWAGVNNDYFYLQTVGNELDGFVGTDLKSLIGEHKSSSHMKKHAGGSLGWASAGRPGIDVHSPDFLSYGTSQDNENDDGGHYPFSKLPVNHSRSGSRSSQAKYRQPTSTDGYDQRKAMAADTAIPTNTGSSHAPVLGDDTHSASSLSIIWNIDNATMAPDVGAPQRAYYFSESADHSQKNYYPWSGSDIQLSSVGSGNVETQIIYIEGAPTPNPEGGYGYTGAPISNDIVVKLPDAPAVGEIHYIVAEIRFPMDYNASHYSGWLFKVEAAASIDINAATNIHGATPDALYYQWTGTNWKAGYSFLDAFDPYRAFVGNREFSAGTSNPNGELAQGFYYGTGVVDALHETSPWKRGMQIAGRSVWGNHGNGYMVTYPNADYQISDYNCPPIADIQSAVSSVSPNPIERDPKLQGFTELVTIPNGVIPNPYYYGGIHGRDEYINLDVDVPITYHVQGTRKVFIQKMVMEAEVGRVTSNQNFGLQNSEERGFASAELFQAATGTTDVDADQVTSGTYNAITQPDTPSALPQYAHQDTCRVSGIVTVWVREELHNPVWVPSFLQVQRWQRFWGSGAGYVGPTDSAVLAVPWPETEYEYEVRKYQECLLDPPLVRNILGWLVNPQPSFEERQQTQCHEPTFETSGPGKNNRIKAAITQHSQDNPVGEAYNVGANGEVLVAGESQQITAASLTGPAMVYLSAKKLQMKFTVNLGPANTAALRSGSSVTIPTAVSYSDVPNHNSSSGADWWDIASIIPTKGYIERPSNHYYFEGGYTGPTGDPTVPGASTFHGQSDPYIHADMQEHFDSIDYDYRNVYGGSITISLG